MQLAVRNAASFGLWCITLSLAVVATCAAREFALHNASNLELATLLQIGGGALIN